MAGGPAAMNRLTHRTACFRRKVPMFGILRRVGRQRVDHTLVYSRFNTFMKLMALGSVLRTLINGVSGGRGSPSVIRHRGGRN